MPAALVELGGGGILTHEDLRKRALRWLTNTKRCGVVLSEMLGGCPEVPDALGFKGHFSYLVECKASRSDFHAQKNKIHERCARGMGQLRYFMCEPHTIEVADIEGTRYGLLWVSDAHGNVRQIIEPTFREDACRDDEIMMLVSALRRVRAREFLVLVPETPEGS